MKKSFTTYLRRQRENMGRLAKCVHTGRNGRVTAVEWRNRVATGGDWGVFLTLTDESGEFTARPAFIEWLEEAP
jgi:hypothetical protein